VDEGDGVIFVNTDLNGDVLVHVASCGCSLSIVRLCE
jgi:hypothetical protein